MTTRRRAGWSSVGSGTDHFVEALQTFDDGLGATLVVGGAFTRATVFALGIRPHFRQKNIRTVLLRVAKGQYNAVA